MNRNKTLWTMFFYSPALCFFKVLFSLASGNYHAVKIIPYVMGLFAYLFPPYSDFARNLDLVYSYQNYPLPMLLAVTSDVVVPTIEYYFLRLNIPIEFFRFIYTFFIYQLFTNIFFDIRQRFNLTRQSSFRVWVFLFMMISFFAYIINLRTLFVNYTLIYCVYKYYIDNKDKYRYLSLLLCFVHFAYFPIILAFFFSKYIRLTISKNIKCIFIFFLLFSSILMDSDFLLSIIRILPLGDVINNKVEIYTEGEWSTVGEAMKAMRTTNFIIYQSLLSLASYYIYYLYIKINPQNRINYYINVLFLVVLLTAPIGALFNRYITFFDTALQLNILYSYAQNNITKKQMDTFIWLCVLNTALNVYANWNCLVNGNVWYLLVPLPFALFQTYNFEEWCRLHLANDFNKIINLSIFSR